MWNRLLFAIYRHTFGLFIYLGFRSQKVRPLEPPIDEQITLVPFGWRKPVADIPRLYDMQSFPKADHARSRRRRIDVTRPLVGALGHLKRPGLPPVPQDHDEMIRAIYPYFFRQSWPEPPTVPPELAETHDPLAAVAVAGPVADYVKRISHDEIDRINDIAPGHVDAGAYTIGLEALARHPVKPGLEPIGCTVVFETDDDTGELRTRSIVYRNEVVTPSTERWHTAERAALCSLTTHLSVIKHNVYVHLMYLTVSTAVTVNTLGADHPIRRLVHHCFQTALIGNYEVAQFQIRGEDAFCCTLFSYDYETMIAVINDHLDTFDLGLLDPVESAQNRGVVDVDFAYPYHANVMPLWDIIWAYVDSYCDHYFPTDAAAADDPELRAWYAELDSRIPNGIEEYAGPLGRRAVKRLCATLIFTSTVTHDNVNNIVWNYTTLPQYFPTVVPSDGSLPRTDMAFDFLTTLIGTWKPFNKLLDGVSSVALDADGRRIMDEFIAAMKRRQIEMDSEPFRYDTIYPKNLDYSISN